MRALFWITALLAALYGGYWFVGSRAALQGVSDTLTQMKAEGRADFADISLRGFPSRFDITIDKPTIKIADQSVAWQAPFLQLLALSYRPNNLIAVWPDQQTLTLGPDTLTLETDDLRASVLLKASLDLGLDHAELEGHGLKLTSAFGWQALADKLIVASRQAGEDGTKHDLALILTGLAPGNDYRGRIDPARRQPAVAEEARLTMTATFDRPLDRRAVEQPVHLVALQAIDLRLKWGTIAIGATGDLTVDGQGTPSGQLALRLTNWRDLMVLLRENGSLSADRADTIERALSAAAATDDPATVSLPLAVRDGMIWLGFIPLAPAPRL